MQVLSSSRRAYALRATTVSLGALVVALLAGAVALAAGFDTRARAAGGAAGATGAAGAGSHHAADEAAPHHEADEAVVLAALRLERVHQARAAAAEASRAAVAERSRVVWPAGGAITGPFAERRGRSLHPGLDIDGETGDPVAAAARGTVAWAGQAPGGFAGYGILVVVDHGDGLLTLYAHLSAVSVSVGQSVRAGDVVGAMGSTGHSTGSHLHFEVRRHGVLVDPATFLPPR